MTHLIEKAADTLQPLAADLASAQNEHILLQRRIEFDGGGRGQARQVHGERGIGRQAQRLIAIAPVFDQGDVGMSLRAGFEGCHVRVPGCP